LSAVVQSDVERLTVAFAYALRDAGVSVPLDSVITFVSAIEATGIDQHESVYWSGRTTLIRRPEDIDTCHSRLRQLSKNTPLRLMTNLGGLIRTQVMVPTKPTPLFDFLQLNFCGKKTLLSAQTKSYSKRRS